MNRSSLSSIYDKLFEQLLVDLRQVVIETKRKQPHIKEAAEKASSSIRQYLLASSDSTVEREDHEFIEELSGEIMRPLVMACIETTRQPLKLVQSSLAAIHRLVQYDVCGKGSLISVADVLIKLGYQRVEELRLIQTALLIVNESNVLSGVKLSQIICLVMNMCVSKDATISNTANAAIKQMTVAVFESITSAETDTTDACSFLNDLCSLAANPSVSIEWLQSLKSFPRAYAIDLINIIVKKYPACFVKHNCLMKIARERIVACISANLVSAASSVAQTNDADSTAADSQHHHQAFAITARVSALFLNIMRRLSVYLTDECISATELIVKSIEPERFEWQKAIGIETLHLLFAYHEILPVVFGSGRGSSVLKDVVERISSFMHSLTMKKNVGSGSHDSSLIQDKTALNKSSDKQVQPTQQQQPSRTQPSFLYSGNAFFLLRNFDPSYRKTLFLDAWDREMPDKDENHLLTECYFCLQQLCSSLTILKTIDGQPEAASHLANCVWTGILSSFQFLLEVSAKTELVDELLGTYEKFICICTPGSSARIELITYSLCRLCFPSGYFLTCLSLPSVSPKLAHKQTTTDDQVIAPIGVKIHNCGSCNNCHDGPCSTCGDTGHQFLKPVVTGISVANAKQPSLVELNYRHLSSLCVLTRICSQSLPEITDMCLWPQVFSVLQHGLWLLSIRPSKDGSKLECENNHISENSTTLRQIDSIINSIEDINHGTRTLTDNQFKQVLMVLLQRSKNEAHLTFPKRQRSLFPVYCLINMALNNCDKHTIWWNLVKDHLLELAIVNNHHCNSSEPDSTDTTNTITGDGGGSVDRKDSDISEELEMSGKFVQLFCSFIKRCLESTENVYETLSPLSRLLDLHDQFRSETDHRIPGLYKCQVETHLYIIRTYSPTILEQSWPLIINAIDKCARDCDEADTNKLAFVCFELIVKNIVPTGIFVSTKSSANLSLLIDALSNFSEPPIPTDQYPHIIDINTTLTSIELLWQIADYLTVNSANLPVNQLNSIWLQLYGCLADPIALDARASVRKSAIHSLFTSCSVHQSNHWGSELRSKLIYDILFPLVCRTNKILQCHHLNQKTNDATENSSNSAGPTKNHTNVPIIIQQWSQTVVFALQGTIDIIGDCANHHNEEGASYQYVDVWQRSIDLIGKLLLSSQSHQIRMASIECLQQLLSLKIELPSEYWHIMWTCFMRRGIELTESTIFETMSDEASQSFFNQFLKLFQPIAERRWNQFTEDYMKIFTKIARTLLLFDPRGKIEVRKNENSIYTNRDLQKTCFGVFVFLRDKMRQQPLEVERVLLISLLECCLGLCDLCMPAMPANLYEFGEQMIEFVVQIYMENYSDSVICENRILLKIIKALHIPLSQRLACPSATTWKLAVKCLIDCVRIGFTTVEPDDSVVWNQLHDTFDSFLFPYPRSDTTSVEFVEYNCIVLDALENLLMLIKIGPESYCSLAKLFFDIVFRASDFTCLEGITGLQLSPETSRRLDFAQRAFGLLAKCATIDNIDCHDSRKQIEPTMLQRLSAPILAQKCKEIIYRFEADQPLANSYLLDESRYHEFDQAGRAVIRMLTSILHTPVNEQTWELLISLYNPLLNLIRLQRDEISPIHANQILSAYMPFLRQPHNPEPSDGNGPDQDTVESTSSECQRSKNDR